MTVKTSGDATPSVLKKDIDELYLPDWSPAGDWITYRDDRGWNLISPDGKTAKFLGKIETRYLAFSRDGSCFTEYGGVKMRPIKTASHCFLSIP